MCASAGLGGGERRRERGGVLGRGKSKCKSLEEELLSVGRFRRKASITRMWYDLRL